MIVCCAIVQARVVVELDQSENRLPRRCHRGLSGNRSVLRVVRWIFYSAARVLVKNVAASIVRIVEELAERGVVRPNWAWRPAVD